MIPSYAFHDAMRHEPDNLDPPEFRIKKIFGIKLPKIQVGRAIRESLSGAGAALGGVFGGPQGAAIGAQGGGFFSNLFGGLKGGGGGGGTPTTSPGASPSGPSGFGEFFSSPGFIILIIAVVAFLLLSRRR